MLCVMSVYLSAPTASQTARHTSARPSLVTEEKGIPYLGIETDYSQSDKGQIGTRLAAFLEML